MKSYRNHTKIRELMLRKLYSIQCIENEKWEGISSNSLWNKLGGDKKPLCSKLTYLQEINRMIKDDRLKVNRKKNWKEKRLLKLDIEFVNFFKDIENTKQIYSRILEEFGKECNKNKNKKFLVLLASKILNDVYAYFGKSITEKMIKANSPSRKIIYQEYFIQHSNILAFFIKEFMKIYNIHGLNELTMKFKNLNKKEKKAWFMNLLNSLHSSL